MNYGGYISLEIQDRSSNEWYLKQWFLLYKNPKNSGHYFNALSAANIYLNKTKYQIEYNVPYENSIFENINTHLV